MRPVHGCRYWLALSLLVRADRTLIPPDAIWVSLATVRPVPGRRSGHRREAQFNPGPAKARITQPHRGSMGISNAGSYGKAQANACTRLPRSSVEAPQYMLALRARYANARVLYAQQRVPLVLCRGDPYRAGVRRTGLGVAHQVAKQRLKRHFVGLDGFLFEIAHPDLAGRPADRLRADNEGRALRWTVEGLTLGCLVQGPHRARGSLWSRVTAPVSGGVGYPRAARSQRQQMADPGPTAPAPTPVTGGEGTLPQRLLPGSVTCG